MKRLLHSLRWNIVLQFRHGFYYVSAFYLLIMVALLRQIPPELGLSYLQSGFVALNLLLNYFFIAALVLLERSEGVLAGLVVTPLRSGEYLMAKVLSLLLLGMLESMLIVVFSFGMVPQPLLILAGMALLSAFYTLIGFVIVARFRLMNEYILPAGALLALLLLPLLDHFHIWQSAFFSLHPLQPMLVLLRAGFLPATPWELCYGFLGSLTWVVLCFLWARRSHTRFVQPGSHF
jgi:fluoroquinolone transport system permease protein